MNDTIITKTLEQWFSYMHSEREKLIRKNTVRNQEAYLAKLMSFRLVAKGICDALLSLIDDAIAKGQANV
jgi:hypothetical protein